MAAMFDAAGRAEHVVYFAAAASAHHEDPYRWFVDNFGIELLQPMVEPSQPQAVVTVECIRTKVDITGPFLVGAHAVEPWTHDQSVRAPLEPAQRYEVLAGGARIRVIPRAEIDRRHVRVLFVVIADRVATLMPIFITDGAGLQVQRPAFVRRQHSQRRYALLERQALEPIAKVVAGLEQCAAQGWIGARLLTGDRHVERINEETLLQRAVVAHRTR